MFNDIIDKYHVYNHIINPKQSKYNSKLYVTECAECGSRDLLETHHNIYPQKSADKNGIIYDKEYLHKNLKWNLQVLCKQCHLLKTYA